MIDLQIGHEKSLTTIIPALAGANMIFGMGMMELGETFSLVQLVIDDMIVEDVKRVITHGLGLEELSDPDFVAKVAEKGFPSKIWWPHRLRDKTPKAMKMDRRKNFVEEAYSKVQSILSSYKPKELPSFMARRIKELVVEAGERRTKFDKYGKY